MTKRQICPNCEAEKAVDTVEEDRSVTVRGAPITIAVRLFRCTECGEEFDTPEHPMDENDLAFREYRCAAGLLQPEEIQSLRKTLGLSQAKMAELLGWSPATISRYETGTIQEVGHDRVLRALMNPDARLRVAMEVKGEKPSESFRPLVQSAASAVLAAPAEYLGELIGLKGQSGSDTGFRAFDFERYATMVAYYAWHCGGVAKTKLNKLMFFSDFEHCHLHGRSISGSRYLHLDFGPCPEHYQVLLGALAEEGRVAIEETPLFSRPGHTAEIIKAFGPPDLTAFSTTEQEVLGAVLAKFRDATSEFVSRVSHDQNAYKKTGSRSVIDYSYAASLKI